MSKSRYILQPSNTPNFWVCTDTVNLIVCTFEQGRFNENQKFTTLEGFPEENFMKLARFTRELGEWLIENHHSKVF